MRPYQHKVQYYETDQMKVVHHSNYIRWFEEARIDYMEQLGMPYEDMEKNGIISPVISVEAEYLRMVKFGDTVVIEAKIKEYNGIKLTIGYSVVDESTGMVHCRGITRHCFLNEKGRPVSLKRECPQYHEMFLKGLEA
ncbi:acyl-CoA thioesterase [Bariatricus massiliensis]|uniref:Acyl-CoA thioesterase n=1 Tax=Bariatricus massiliensis TaxID=1745713 RepID=A0ABS8DB69_9FIRM|nr:acyl-CoA thioesterase [Bariatricus massiliensis]MCB7303581.1 acyl-CoA thioesterase [Bariatricus massiliensis]MCB7372996.1 acyl-CoA thioesterase [Bariatricus massiliensis]MCB7385666.1 acyl-CoA thioesterase [Bariatricus massiliensis]MCB7409829.1 acyl-CoA thioesterase [Bariatricus massiliensis]MCQ5254061.1 acyl-CoA thioesterase [Bariatricus massiliensis]